MFLPFSLHKTSSMVVLQRYKYCGNPEKLTAYFGVVPSVSQSNQQCTIGKITKHGPKMARTSLVQCTWVAIRYSLYLRSFYEHVKKERGSAKAIITTARIYKCDRTDYTHVIIHIQLFMSPFLPQ